MGKQERRKFYSRSSSRVVLHVDLDAFFVQVERSLNPTLVGKPMVVQQHADVIAVSYEARELGVTKHMPTATIRKRFPSVKLVHVQTMGAHNEKVSYRNYRRAARSIFKLIQAFCPPEEGGTFQRASVDEAYLEPSHRTLALALDVPEEQRPASEPASPGGETEGTRSSDPHSGTVDDVSSSRCGEKEGTRNDDPGSGTANIANRIRERDSDGDRDGDGLTGSESRNSKGRGPTREGDYDEVKAESPSREPEEEDRLLKAGGLLGRRIQQALREVLEYDCSVGVATNKFLAKLTTSLAKPKGVRVLRRRDVTQLLSTTLATKIHGCGEGSTAAKQFASWGVRSVSDLHRFGAAELRAGLGEQVGAKVYDRCRGIDHDPVELDPAPSRVSSVVSLVPLIKPAYCLGKPGEKLTPVFPWELKRLQPFLETLVDDLIDRMKEEFEERGRRPTKLCVEHHLHHRGSKSQTLVLPPTPPPSFRRIVSPVPGQSEKPQGFAPEEAITELIGLPPPAVLVELALSPFNIYCHLGGRGEGTVGGNPRSGKDETPPVVKLNLSFLGFESVIGAAAAMAGHSRQQQLRLTDMMHRDNRVAEQMRGTVDRREGDGNPKRRDDLADVVIEADVAPAPACASPATPSPLVALEEGSILVRCPRCKACLPLGAAWDAHRDEHVSSLSESAAAPAPAMASKSSPRTEKRRKRDVSSSLSPSRSPSAKRRSPLASSRMMTEEIISPMEVGTGGRDIPGSSTAIGGGMGAGPGPGPGPSAGGRERLSSLLGRAVTPSQAADVLRERGLLPANGRTRFTGVFLDS